jgi:hypothetical protein
MALTSYMLSHFVNPLLPAEFLQIYFTLSHLQLPLSPDSQSFKTIKIK